MSKVCRKLRETGLLILLVSFLDFGLVPSTSRASLFDEQTRVALDVSSRINLNQVSDKSSMIHFVGLDFFRPFSRNGLGLVVAPLGSKPRFFWNRGST